MSNERADDNGLKAGATPPALSLVMMVKDEEQNLPRALASAKPWVDEIIVVDTGSTDRTVEIAQEYGAKVFHHPWQNDFSLHRNQALSYASGSWCLALDADEEIDQATAPLLAELISDEAVNGFYVELCNIFGQGKRNQAYQIRLFRNLPGVKYHQKVHNQISVPGNLAKCGLRVLHYGYAGDQAQMAAKHARRESMIQDWLDQEPENWLPHYYMAQALLLKPGLVETAEGLGRRYNQEILSQAVGQAETALGLAREQTADISHLSMIHVPLVQALAILGPEEAFLRHLEKWRTVDPENLDPYFFLVDHFYQKGDWSKLSQSASRFCELHAGAAEYLKAHPQVELNTVGLKNAVLVAWLVAEARLDRRREALGVFGQILAGDQAEQVAKVAIERVRKEGLTDLADELEQRAAAGSGLPDWEDKESDSSSDPLSRARDLSRGGLFDEAAGAFDQAFAQNSPGPKELCELAYAHAGAQRWDAAEKCYLRALDLDEREVGALFNLGVVQARQGKMTQAAESLERCLDLEPSLSQARQLLHMIQTSRAGQGVPAAAG